MKLSKTLLTLPVLVAFSLPALGQNSAQDEVDLDDITMDVVREDVRHANRIPMPARDIIIDYMLENGDITPEQIEQRIAERKALSDELKELKESGDREAIIARFAELREQGQMRRDAVRAYIEENEDLREALIDELSQNAELRERVLERRDRNQEVRDRIKEKLKERRDRAGAQTDG